MHKKFLQPGIDRLQEIVATLRNPGGCPWDAKQTPESLKSHIIEETYEVLEAIDLGNAKAICEELGDLLLQVVFQARIFEERGLFSLEDVANGIADKLERRHPHVFNKSRNPADIDLHKQWERIKREEKSQQGQPTSTLGNTPTHLPALLKAKKIAQNASRAGFDWPDLNFALAKVHEELAECEEAFLESDHHKKEDELGDLLFAVVNVGRLLDIDAENALGKTINRFIRRFTLVEKALNNQGRNIDSASFNELLRLWNDAKQQDACSFQGSQNTPPQR
jgi:MazG family protein